MANLLWITPKSPFPAHDGARVASLSLLKSLSQHLHITLLSYTESSQVDKIKQSIPKILPNLIHYHSLPITVPKNPWDYLKVMLKQWKWVPHLPISFLRYFQDHHIQTIKNYIEKEKPDAILGDGLHVVAPFVFHPQLQSYLSKLPIIYRAHNVESDLWYQMAEIQTNIFLKAFLKFQAELVKEIEIQTLSKVRLTLWIAHEDQQKMQSLMGTSNLSSYVLPVGIEFCPVHPIPGPPYEVLFLGRLDWPPNRHGLTWFLQNVWPYVHRTDLTLTIAGSGNGSWLKDYLVDQRIQFLGEVENKESIYQRCIIAIAPIFWGSGIRIKILEPASYGRACLTTLKALQGSILTDQEVIIANTSENWITILNSLTPEQVQTYAQRSRAKIQSLYHPDLIAQQFCNLFNQLKTIQS